MHAERVRKYSFVTANQVESQSIEGKPQIVTRQGVYMGLLPNEIIIIAAVGGITYRCLPEVQEVDDSNLDPPTMQYVQKIRDLNR